MKRVSVLVIGSWASRSDAARSTSGEIRSARRSTTRLARALREVHSALRRRDALRAVGARTPARTVVLVHGFSVPYYIWDSTTTALAAAGYRVVRYDEYGRGLSDRPNVDYTADLYDRQLERAARFAPHHRSDRPRRRVDGRFGHGDVHADAIRSGFARSFSSIRWPGRHGVERSVRSSGGRRLTSGRRWPFRRWRTAKRATSSSRIGFRIGRTAIACRCGIVVSAARFSRRVARRPG